MDRDYYSILEIDKDASEDEIKKSYKKLALKYHPDKNHGNDEACEKFKDISMAYSVLSDKDKKRQYDTMGSVDFEGDDPFSVFNNIFQQHINSFMNMKYEKDINISNIFSNISGMSEESFPFGGVRIKVHTFPSDQFDFGERIDYNNFLDKDYQDDNDNDIYNDSPINNLFQNLFQKKPKSKINRKIETKIIYDKPENIIYNINVSLEDIYNQKTRKILISRYRKKNNKYMIRNKKIEIPLYGKEILLEGEGHEMKDYKEKGDVIINIFNIKNDNFKRINEYDILTTKEIYINDIYNGFTYDLILPTSNIKVKSEPLIGEDFMIQKIYKKGLPYKNNYDELYYGNLYILYKIIFPKDIDDLKNISDISEINELENNDLEYDIAYNCSINEIFQND